MPDIDPARARWITAPGSDPQNPLLRRRLILSSPPRSARLLVTGLGVFRAHLNGVPVRRTHLDPGLTDPRRRVLVCEADATALLHEGENVLGIALGRGFHAMATPNVWRWHQAPWRGPVRTWARLEAELEDGSSVEATTGPGWRTAPGPVVFDSMYEGESFEPTGDPEAWLHPGFDDSAWPEAIPAEDIPPGVVMQRQTQEPVVIGEEIVPEIRSHAPDRIVLDMGRVIAGWCRYELSPIAGAGAVSFTARHGEKLDADGGVDDANQHVFTERFQEDRVQLDPTVAPCFAPQFSYKGFRYVQLEPIRGELDRVQVTGVLAHADLTPASTLSSSNAYLEDFHAAMRASLLNNMHHVPTDTPMHEKNGWTGDALTSLPAMATGFDMRRMLRKFLDDQVDGQRADGSLSVIAPNPGWGYEELSPAPEWTTLLPVLIDELATEYGEVGLVDSHGPAAANHLRHELSRRDEQGLISSALGDYLSPGTAGNAREDRRLTSTLFVARALRSFAHAIELAAPTEHALRADDSSAARRAGAETRCLPEPIWLRDRAVELEAAVNAAFLDAERGLYLDTSGAGYRQTGNALALACGIVPDELVAAVVGNLVSDIRARGDHHDCGHIGVRFLLPVLSEHGHGDLALRVLENPTAPGWRAWLEAGNSTFMEMWENPRSCSHYFMGTPVTWIHEHVVGLRRGPGGWQQFMVAPDPRVPVGRIAMTRRTDHGTIGVEVDRDARTVTVDVPEEASARVVVPGNDSVVTAGRRTVTW